MAFTSDNAAAAGKKGGSQPKKRDVVTQHIIAELNEIDATTKVSKARMLAKALVANAVGGDIQAQRECIDRAEGKARQEVGVAHEGEITLKSAAISVLDELTQFALTGRTGSADTDPLPN